MNEEKAFLAAIAANLDDDTPRLQYADWLRENGQDERGEFIQVQIELDRTEIRHPKYEKLEALKACPCEWCRLKYRARELCHGLHQRSGMRYGEFWAGEPLNRIPDAYYTYRRGLIHSVEMECDLWLENATAVIAVQPTIREVRLSDKWPEEISVDVTSFSSGGHSELIQAFLWRTMGEPKSAVLPTEIFHLLEGGNPLVTQATPMVFDVKIYGNAYETSEQASDFLWRACLAFARGESKLTSIL